MVALNFLKFWRPSTVSTTIVEVGEEEEESFFDLELSVSGAGGEEQSNLVVSVEQQPAHDVFSKRKINPIEPSVSCLSPKTESSISLLKSSPEARAMEKTSKPVAALTGVNGREPEMKRRSDGSFSKRFSNNAIQKYLKRIKPRKSPRSKMSSYSSTASPPSTPGPASWEMKEKNRDARSAIRAVCKNLGKSKSSSATVGIESPARRDDSLIQQNDGIQSAILHCKRSFNSSRESSMLSRSSIDSIKSLSSDCSVLSRFSTDKLVDPAMNSKEERSSVS